MQALARSEPGLPRALRHELGNRGPRQVIRTGRPHAAWPRPQAVDFSNEPKHVLDLYGIGDERHRRFWPAVVAGSAVGGAGRAVHPDLPCGHGGNGSWDAHDDIRTQGPLCRATDKPIAGLIRDLKQRGMLDETLVVWTSEFGRSPGRRTRPAAITIPRGFTSWLAGGGVKGGHRPRRHRRRRLSRRREPPLFQRSARHDSAPARPRSSPNGTPGPGPHHAPHRKRRSDRGDSELNSH